MSPFGIAVSTVSVSEDGLLLAIKDFMVDTLGWDLKKTDQFPTQPFFEAPTFIVHDYHILYSNGESGIEKIYVGMAEFQLTASIDAGLQFQAYTGFDNARGFCNQPGAICCWDSYAYSSESWFGLPALPCSGIGTLTGTPENDYWLYGDKDCVVIITKTTRGGSEFYHSAYLGVVDRFLSTVQDPRPMYVAGSGHWCGGGTACCWDNPYANSWIFGLTGLCGIKYIRNRPDFDWVCSRCNTGKVDPSACSWIAHGVFANLCNQPSVFGAGRTLSPITVANDVDGIRGLLKYVYTVGQKGLTAEETLTIDGNNYKVFPNVLGTLDDERWVAVRDYI